jgi:hypothetical protein
MAVGVMMSYKEATAAIPYMEVEEIILYMVVELMIICLQRTATISYMEVEGMILFMRVAVMMSYEGATVMIP